MSNHTIQNTRALLVTRKTYEQMESLFGSMENGAEDAVTAMIKVWLERQANPQAPIILPQNAPLHSVNGAKISSATITIGDETINVHEADDKSAPTWNQLTTWLADHVAIDSNGYAFIFSGQLPDGAKYAVLEGMFEYGGATIQAVPRYTDNPFATTPVKITAPRGWNYAPQANVMIRVASAMQSLRLIRHIVDRIQNASITLNLAWDSKTNAPTGAVGKISLKPTGKPIKALASKEGEKAKPTAKKKNRG